MNQAEHDRNEAIRFQQIMNKEPYKAYMPPITLTKLEYFAGQAMQGLLANSEVVLSSAEMAEVSINKAKELIKQLGEVEQ